jgi:ribosomal-protein-alanine N-acetyltransferase
MGVFGSRGHELGFHLLKAKWGRGYAFEAARGVVRHGFEKLQLRMLRAGHHPDHVNSKKILLKLGFQFVDEVFYKPTGLMHPTYKLGVRGQAVATVRSGENCK